MIERKNLFLGIMAIIVGLLIMIFPLISTFALTVLVGIGITFLGIWLLFQSYKIWGKNLAAGIADLLLSIFAIIIGLGFIGNVTLFALLTYITIYLVAFFLLITGLTALLSGKDLKSRLIGILGVVFAILYIVIDKYSDEIVFLAAIIGAFLIILGIMEIFTPKKWK